MANNRVSLSSVNLSIFSEDFLTRSTSLPHGTMFVNSDSGNVEYIDPNGMRQVISGTTQTVLRTQIFQHNVETYADLPTTGNTANDLAFVRTSTGTQFLPGSLGGSFRKKGAYVWDGTTWTSADNEVSNAIASLQTELRVQATFPADSASTQGDVLILTAADAGREAGIYQYNGTDWILVVATIPAAVFGINLTGNQTIAGGVSNTTDFGYSTVNPAGVNVNVLTATRVSGPTINITADDTNDRVRVVSQANEFGTFVFNTTASSTHGGVTVNFNENRTLVIFEPFYIASSAAQPASTYANPLEANRRTQHLQVNGDIENPGSSVTNPWIELWLPHDSFVTPIFRSSGWIVNPIDGGNGTLNGERYDRYIFNNPANSEIHVT